MDIQDGIDRQAKTLYKGDGVYQYMLRKGGGGHKVGCSLYFLGQ